MFRPMLASLAEPPLADPQLVYEPKYDGIRAIAEVSAQAVRLWSRLGNEKTAQFPEIASALQQWARTAGVAVVLDGEIVALDATDEPAGFQNLQGRIHQIRTPQSALRNVSVAFIVFDLLREGARDLRDRPLIERRAALEQLFARKRVPPIVRLSTIVRGDARALYKKAVDRGWEGLIAKHAASLYKSGKRTPDWRKIKITHEQEFVVGGSTEPRQTRAYFGALLLGVYEMSDKSLTPHPKSLIYVGHTGTGFDERELARVMKLLEPLETKECPFRVRPKTNERPHWTRPELVAQIRFTEWTADAKLRHPVYLGLRDDKRPAEVRREDTSRPPGARTRAPDERAPRSRTTSRSAAARPGAKDTKDIDALIEQLRAIE